MIKVIDNADASRYEVVVDGENAGFAAYRVSERGVLLPHVEVRPELNGRGIGSALVQGALDDIRGQGRRVVPLCPFVVHYIAEHPEYQDLVTTL